MKGFKWSATTVLAAAMLSVAAVDVSAKFISPDPVPVDTQSAQNFNRYAYANNSPYKFTDPDGRNPKGCGDGTCNGIMLSGALPYRQGVHGRIEELRAASPELAGRIDVLENSQFAHRVVDSSKNPVVADTPANINLTSSAQAERDGTGTGTTTFYNPDQRMTPEGSAMGSPQGVLAHELLGHAYDKDQGENDQSKNPDTGNSRAEERANQVERRYVDGVRVKDE